MEIKTREIGKINEQRSVFQKKEKAKTLKELSEVEIGNLLTKVFRVTTVKDDQRICRHFNDNHLDLFIFSISATSS